MTMLNTSNYSAAPGFIRGAINSFLAVLARLVHHWVAAMIAHRARQANLAILRSLTDRELRDIGLSRGEIGEGLSEAARARLQLQRSVQSR
jgi:uncharacterized protein YjiS (DUF1127 family)